MSMDDAIPVSEVRRVINTIMSHSSSQMQQMKDAIKAREDENDPLLATKQYAQLIEYSAWWHTALKIANELKIKLDS